MGEQSEFRNLREWTPMSRLLQQIPLKAQKGLFTYDLNLTCIDSLPDYLALGTNVGLVYWYDRRKDELQRLRCENSSSGIVCISVVSNIDYMVAAGSEDGNVTVFQIPKPAVAAIALNLKSKENRQIERFTVSGLHIGPVSALEWSPNGMNLYSGDRSGMIVLTEIDFYMHLSKSREILNEKYEVVQLSYMCGIPHGKQLLVSTVYRSTLCVWHQDERLWKVSQLGHRERKVLGQFGATFYHSVGTKGGASHHDAIFASRPGLRLWQAGLDGVVQQTLIFKDALMCPHPSIMLVNPVPSRFGAKHFAAEKTSGKQEASAKYEEEEHRGDMALHHQLGYLHPFDGGLLVAHWKGLHGCILVLDTDNTGIVASAKTGPGGLRSILSVAVTPASTKVSESLLEDHSAELGFEMFVLEGGRSLIRISNLPDYSYSQGLADVSDDSIRSFFSPPRLPSPPLLLKDLTTSLLELTTGPGHLKGEQECSAGDGASSSKANRPSVTGVVREDNGVVMAIEAVEVPPVVSLPFHEVPDLLQINSPEQPNGSNKEERNTSTLFEDVLYKPRKKKKPYILDVIGSEGSSTQSTGSEEDGGAPLKEGGEDTLEHRRRKSELANVNLRSSVVEEGHVGGVGSWMPFMPLAPDLRSPTSIRQDVESKGELLAKLLGLKPIAPVEHSSEDQVRNRSPSFLDVRSSAGMEPSCVPLASPIQGCKEHQSDVMEERHSQADCVSRDVISLSPDNDWEILDLPPVPQ